MKILSYIGGSLQESDFVPLSSNVERSATVVYFTTGDERVGSQRGSDRARVLPAMAIRNDKLLLNRAL